MKDELFIGSCKVPHDMLGWKALTDAHGFLLPTLRIRYDSCWSVNNNKYIFGLCTMLVGLQIFEEVEMGFLLVGPTHEDIDQIFLVLY